MSTYKHPLQRIAATLFVSVALLGCNDENRAHDDNTRPEHNASRLPGNEAPNEYNLQPALPLKTATNEALRYPVAPRDTANRTVNMAEGSAGTQDVDTNNRKNSLNSHAPHGSESVR
ncbi:MAG TPA: hypothetical protein VEY71_07180 [Chitinophagales bacterium]|nr:hypothetical protein [Chitinophagales bacterium]